MKTAGFIIGLTLVVVILYLVMAWPVQILWNLCLVPTIDGLNFITYWQSLGILLLFRLIIPGTVLNNKASSCK